MADYGAWEGLGRALGGGGEAYQRAKAARGAADRQAKIDSMGQEEHDLKMQEGQPGYDSLFGGGVKATRREALDQQENMAQMEQARKLAGMKGGMGGVGVQGGMTPGRKAADMAFGKDYVDWTAGGQGQAEKGLNKLKDARSALAPIDPATGQPKVRDDISGGFRGLLPDVVRGITNPEAVEIKEGIRSAVMGTLRATLGSAFTDREGERIFNLAYNDRLSEEENIKRLDAAIKEIQAMQQAKESQAGHFEQTGTLTGWTGHGAAPQGQSGSGPRIISRRPVGR